MLITTQSSEFPPPETSPYEGSLDNIDQILIIEYRDNGKGISNISDEIFEPFNMGGGLGMAHIKKVVENHNGEVHLQRPHTGLHIVISIPYMKKDSKNIK